MVGLDDLQGLASQSASVWSGIRLGNLRLTADVLSQDPQGIYTQCLEALP